MATTIVKTPNPINPNLDLNWLREQMLDMLQRSQGDSDKGSDPEDCNYYQGCADTAKHVLDLITMPDLRLVCEYQLASEMEDVREWMVENFNRGIEEAIVLRGTVTGVYPGSFGLRLVTFTVDIPYAGVLFEEGITPAEKKARAEEMLEGLIHDTDLRVRWVGFAD